MLSKVEYKEKPEKKLGRRALLDLEVKEPGLHPEADRKPPKSFKQKIHMASFVLLNRSLAGRGEYIKERQLEAEGNL